MIARIWHGRTKAEDSDRYVEYVKESGVNGLRSASGNLAALVFRRVNDDDADIYVFSIWDSMESIKGFAGDNPEIPVYYPQDDQYLLEFEKRVEHYDLEVAELNDSL